MLRRRITRPLPDFARGGAALVNDLIEAAVEPGQGLGDAVGCLRRCWHVRRRRGSSGTRLRVGLRHAFELPRQRIETIVDGSEVLADVFVVIRFPV